MSKKLEEDQKADEDMKETGFGVEGFRVLGIWGFNEVACSLVADRPPRPLERKGKRQ